jgi:hypothetical protein
MNKREKPPKDWPGPNHESVQVYLPWSFHSGAETGESGLEFTE